MLVVSASCSIVQLAGNLLKRELISMQNPTLNFVVQAAAILQMLRLVVFASMYTSTSAGPVQCLEGFHAALLLVWLHMLVGTCICVGYSLQAMPSQCYTHPGNCLARWLQR